MTTCPNCRKQISENANYCDSCGTMVSNLTQNVATANIATAAPLQNGKGFGQLSQSRTAIYIAVGIIFLFDIISFIYMINGDSESPRFIFVSLFWDIFFGIFLLFGKKWAKTWTIVRAIIGAVIFSFLYIASGDYGSTIFQIGLSLGIILLLTGKSTGARIGSSIALIFATFIIGVIVSIIYPGNSLF